VRFIGFDLQLRHVDASPRMAHPRPGMAGRAMLANVAALPDKSKTARHHAQGDNSVGD
jgi:hypothetical protein